MKHLRLAPLTLLTLFVFAANIYAQHQRLGLQPQTIKIKGGGSEPVEAYCLDKHLRATLKPVDYKVVLTQDASAMVTIGNRQPISLKQAISEGSISVKGGGHEFPSHLGLTFVSNVDEPITIRVVKPLAMSETKEGWVNPAVLKLLENSAKPATAKELQDPIWLAGENESRLQALGYYDGDVESVTFEKVKEATRAFQSSKGLNPTGRIDPQTANALQREEEEFITKLKRLGFFDPPQGTDVQSVGEALRMYQQHLGMKETGILNNALRTQIADDLRYIGQISDVEATKLGPSEYLNSPSKNPNILTYQKLEYNTATLVETPNGPVFWLRDERGMIPEWVEFKNHEPELKIFQRTSGARAIRFFDYQALRDAARRSSSDTFVVQTGVYRPDGVIPIAFGKGEPILTTTEEMTEFLVGRRSLGAIDKRIVNLKSVGEEKPKVIVSRSAFSQGRGGDAGNGKSPLTDFGYEQVDPLKFALALHRRYGDKFDVFIANDLSLGIENIQNLPKLRQSSQVGVYMDKAIKSYSEVSNIKKDLRDAGIKIVRAGNASTGQPNILLFAARRDAEFEKFVEQLAEQGQFKNSIVAFAVCGEGCELPFNSMIIRKSGARAILFYDQRISPQAVEDVLLRFSQIIKEEGTSSGSFQDIWRRSVEDVLKNCKAPECDREDVEKLRDVFIQVSSLWVPGLRNNAE